MDLRNKKIMVTDADGFIGSHLTKKMVEKGYRVKAFVFYTPFNTYGPRQSLRAGSNFEISISGTARAIAEFMDVEIQIQSESQRMRPEKSEVNRL